MPRKKRGLQAPTTHRAKSVRRAERNDRRARRKAKLEYREHGKRDKKPFSADQWSQPAPSHLVAKLERPAHKSRYHSYFEFAENKEKKEKRLEFQVTNDSNPQPGFRFVPIGDPLLTNECKEMSRELGAMIFIVSASKEENSKISEHIYRTGYHFRETIVDAAQEKLGERLISTTNGSAQIEPIPESQQEINTQADGAIRDLFPRIPHTDRQMIIEHAFKKGALFHGEPTVGLQSNIPLSRRVQLAVLAHIRHTHTRYDRLLRETTWMNARKAVEPVCLDVLVRWRGDEETGRDQIDEILREVVIITDSEDSDDSSEEEDSSDDDGEVTSGSSGEISNPNSRNEMRPSQAQNPDGEAMSWNRIGPIVSIPYHQAVNHQRKPERERKAQRGFKRYQAAWEQAKSRQDLSAAPTSTHPSITATSSGNPQSNVGSPFHEATSYSQKPSPKSQYKGVAPDHSRRQDSSMTISKPTPYYSQQRPASGAIIDRNEVMVPFTPRPTYYENAPQRTGTSPSSTKEQRSSLLVRGSPSRGLQDMLVPSIETGSSDALTHSPRPTNWRDVYGDFEQDSYPRFVVERRRRSPESRPVIIIEDDNPHNKRRRVIQEDDSGRFRPLPPHDQRLFITAPRDSHLIPVPSVPPRDFLVERPRLPSQSSQGLFRETQPPLTEPPTGYRLPIYDAPPETRYFTPSSDHHRRSEIDGYPRVRPIESQNPSGDVGVAHVRRQADHTMRVIERENIIRQVDSDFGPRSQTQQMPLPQFSAQNGGSRSYDTRPDPAVADQTFIHNFSQSGIDPYFSRAREGFTVLPESSHPAFLSSGNIAQRYEDSTARSSVVAHNGQERSQVQYLERPMHPEPSRQPAFYEQWPQMTDSQPLPHRERLPQGYAPTEIGNVDPRRQVIVYE